MSVRDPTPFQTRSESLFVPGLPGPAPRSTTERPPVATVAPSLPLQCEADTQAVVGAMALDRQIAQARAELLETHCRSLETALLAKEDQRQALIERYETVLNHSGTDIKVSSIEPEPRNSDSQRSPSLFDRLRDRLHALLPW